MSTTSKVSRGSLQDDVRTAEAELESAIQLAPIHGLGGTIKRDLLLAVAKAHAMLEAHNHQTSIAYGIGMNDVTGELEAAWCPSAAVNSFPCVREQHGAAFWDVGSRSVETMHLEAVPTWAAKLDRINWDAETVLVGGGK